MSRPSRFDVARRRAAVARAVDEGVGPEQVATELDVHPATIYRWAGELTGSRAAQRPDGQEDVSRRLVRSAQELLREREYAAITMKMLAGGAGVSVRSAYQHFDTKQDVFSAAVDAAATEIIERIAQESPRHLSPEPLEQLRELLLVAARCVYTVQGAHVLFCDVGLPREVVDTGRWHQLFVDVVARLLHEAQRLGQLDPDDDADHLAVGIVAGVRGVHAAVLSGSTDAATGLRLVGVLARVGSTSPRVVGG